MPAAKGRKTVKVGAKSQKVTKKTADDGEYQDEVDSEEEEASVSSDTNEADMELFRAAFASVKSKNTKKKNAEFMKKNQALIDEARGQAEAMKLAGLAHLEQLVQGFEAASQPPNNEDISAFANLAASRELFETSKQSIEELTADYEEAYQAADDEVQKRVQRRERIRRHTVRHTYQILERGIEEQKSITDATNFIKNFQRLMSL
ncbi:serine carboxypeptidase, putative, partial [Rhizoctonia solani AG-3 Rhs1AP]